MACAPSRNVAKELPNMGHVAKDGVAIEGVCCGHNIGHVATVENVLTECNTAHVASP